MQEVICVLGMHRSGTSMVARLLRAQGVYLGTDDELLGPNDGNPLGHFEHMGLLEINDSLLTYLGGSLYDPPRLGDYWWKSASVEPLLSRARRVVESFRSYAIWGWKDPRTSLLVPFWLQLIPNMRFVICVRNPLEVALSMERRQGMAREKAARLWHEYTSSAIRETENRPRIFVHYSDFFSDISQETKRLAGFCRVPNREPCMSEAGYAMEQLRHHRVGLSDLFLDSKISTECKMLYMGLRALLLERQTAAKTVGSASPDSMDGEGVLYRSVTTYYDASLVAQTETANIKLKIEIGKLHAEKEQLATTLGAVYSTVIWRFASWLENWKEKILPKKTLRRGLYDRLLKGFKTKMAMLESDRGS